MIQIPFLSKKTSSGVFIPTDTGYQEVKVPNDCKSINDCTIYFGYKIDEVKTYNGRISDSSKILCIIFEVFTENIVFIFTEKTKLNLTERDVRKYLTDFSFFEEYDSLDIRNILDDGIENESLSIEFLSRVLNLENVSRNGMFYSEKINTYLYFTNGVLTNYQYNDGYFPWSKYLKEKNSIIYNKVANAALKHRADNSYLAQKEINIQSEAWSSIPEAHRNEFVKLHEYGNSFINFHMLGVCHYGWPINKEEFEELNHGRYTVESRDANLQHTYKLGGFIYTFNSYGNLDRIDMVMDKGTDN